MSNTLLRIQNLTKQFDEQTALQNLDLTLPAKQMIGIVGPDGAGKTTLLRLIGALLTPTTGSIEVLGCDSCTMGEKIHAFSGYMPQRFGLYEDLNVIQNLELYASLRGLKREKWEETFEKLLQFTGLAPFRKRRASDLSGGMKQKLGLSCTLVQKPELLILDEPTVGVDPISRRELWKMVESLLKEGVSILWSTAYLNEAEKCDRIVLLNEGTLLYEGPPAELTKRAAGRVFLIEEPREERRRRLFELENRDDVVDAMIQGKYIRIVAKTESFVEGQPIAPRLEDAFIDLLGGKEKGEMKLSQAAPTTPPSDEEEIIAKNLIKRFGSFTAVDNISFTVKRGEIFGLLGPNGAGKSTMFKMLSGLLKPTEGTAKVGGLDLQKAGNLARAKIGYMAQKFSLYGNLTVRQNLAFFSRIYETKGKIQEKLEIFDLTGLQNRTAETLSAGLKQKLALSIATIHWPELLFLDEPTSGMDPVSRRQFWSQMNALARKGKSILVSTHFMDEAENCDRIGLIYRGKAILLDTPDKIKEHALTEENQNPTLEDAFIRLIEEYDATHP